MGGNLLLDQPVLKLIEFPEESKTTIQKVIEKKEVNEYLQNSLQEVGKKTIQIVFDSVNKQYGLELGKTHEEKK
ncbi:hypothetical protein Bealeia1_00967 [Candidatus Bealeia paramacronuclearis]|uniref:Uncharacterized protein n=1 Tax=Candidatus Bealeia paramacronuclearis TaxID=1921001 RepID=A0ABZ2C5R6_9PROT|nr:hypothetical protein [Candidatus Bealeia paramacronuclearis]